MYVLLNKKTDVSNCNFCTITLSKCFQILKFIFIVWETKYGILQLKWSDKSSVVDGSLFLFDLSPQRISLEIVLGSF